MGQEQEPASHSFVVHSPQAEQQLPPSQQQTLALPAVSAPLEPPEPGAPASRTKLPLKRKLTRIIAIAVVLGLAVVSTVSKFAEQTWTQRSRRPSPFGLPSVPTVF